MVRLPDIFAFGSDTVRARSNSCPFQMMKRSSRSPSRGRDTTQRLEPRPAHVVALMKSSREPSRGVAQRSSPYLDTPETLLSRTKRRRHQNRKAHLRTQSAQPTSTRRHCRDTKVELATSMPPTFDEQPPSYAEVVPLAFSTDNRGTRSIILQKRCDELFLEPAIGKERQHRRRRTIQIYREDDLFSDAGIIPTQTAAPNHLADVPVLDLVIESTPIDAANLFGWGIWASRSGITTSDT